MGESYDVRLDEASVAASAPPLQPCSTPESGIESGLFIFNGQVLLPPYSVTHKISSKTDAVVLVNDVIVATFSPPPPLPPEPPAALPADGQFSSVPALRKYACDVLYPQLRKNGLNQKDALSEVGRFFETQDIVASVIWGNWGPDPRPVLKSARDPRMAMPIFPAGYDFVSGRCMVILFPEARIDKMLECEEQAIREGLKRGFCIIRRGAEGSQEVGVGQELLVELRKRMLESIDLPLLKAECIINEIAEDRLSSRWMSAHLRSVSRDLLMSLLERQQGECR